MQFLQNGETIHFRHKQIKDDCMRRFGVDGLPALAAAFGEDWFVPTMLMEDLFDQTKIIGIIIDHENLMNRSISIQPIESMDQILLQNRLDKIICRAEAKPLIGLFQ